MPQLSGVALSSAARCSCAVEASAGRLRGRRQRGPRRSYGPPSRSSWRGAPATCLAKARAPRAPSGRPPQRAQAERCGACSLLPPPPVSAGHGRVRRAQARRCATSSLTPSALPQCCPCLRAFPRRRSGSWCATRAYSWRCGCARRSHSRCTRRTCAAQSCGPLRCACRDSSNPARRSQNLCVARRPISFASTSTRRPQLCEPAWP